MNPSRLVILCNGEKPDKNRFLSDLNQADLLICADGGANTAMEFDCIPDIIIGDFDSVTPETLARCQTARCLKIDEQETTDFEKVLMHIGQWPNAEVTVWGALGLRIDHTIGNLSSLIRIAGQREIILKSNNAISYAIRSGFSKVFPAGKTISLIPIPVAEGIVTSGLVWPLNNESLIPGVRNGTLNKSVGGEVTISYQSGNLILMEIDG